MHIKRFRIRNYRSIRDSGDCYLSQDDITILAGKNESGKTAILEALEDFNYEKPIRHEAVPIGSTEAKPEISVTFGLQESTTAALLEAFKHATALTNIEELQVVKRYPSEYSLIPLPATEQSTQYLTALDADRKRNIQKTIGATQSTYEELLAALKPYPKLAKAFPHMTLGDVSGSVHTPRIEDFKLWANNALPGQPNQLSTLHQLLMQNLSTLLELQEDQPFERGTLRQIRARIPNFILFSSFDDIFPSEISIQDAKLNPLMQDLATISDLDLDLITSASSSAKQTHKRRLNFRLNADYHRFWTQDVTNLTVDWDSGNLHFFIEEDDEHYEPKMRSKGKQWHLAFYVRVSARARTDVPNILLIDEPGLYLHAKAQQDVLRVLEDSAKKTPVIFSTHSPYLIDTHTLSRVRLVTKTTKGGTVISNKVHKDADKETLTPIMTAIGLDLSRGLDIAKDNNLICEGITDYYYLSAFKALLNYNFKNEVHFIPCVGADKCPLLAYLMVGWGLNYCVLLDNDDKGRQVKRKLLKQLGHLRVKTVATSEKENEEIEDLFTREDFANYVLKENPTALPSNQRNSEVIKQGDNAYDKVLLSKLFSEEIQKGVEGVGPLLSSETRDRFRNLLQQVDQALFGNA